MIAAIAAACGSCTATASRCEDPPVIRKILEHLGLPSKPPIIHPARSRGPPGQAFPDDDLSQMPAFDLA